MFERKISKELAEKIVKYNPQLNELTQYNLIEFGILIRENVNAVLANTPGLTEEEKQLIQNEAVTVSRRGPRKKFSIDPEVLQKLTDKINTLPQEDSDIDDVEPKD